MNDQVSECAVRTRLRAGSYFPVCSSIIRLKLFTINVDSAEESNFVCRITNYPAANFDGFLEHHPHPDSNTRHSLAKLGTASPTTRYLGGYGAPTYLLVDILSPIVGVLYPLVKD